MCGVCFHDEFSLAGTDPMERTNKKEKDVSNLKTEGIDT
ncbi:hypothetical protein LEP1GSC017_0533 [Leptospira meyeri serovar Hardjo str. Went 5]|nr:hypothetical protein LEP1GSC017_0533 [Leptospira meyeri serovar Hardjo str. Went 5]